MSRRKPKTKRFNKRYGTRVRTDLQQQRNEAALKAAEAKDPAGPNGGESTASAA